MIYITRRETFNAAHKLWNPDWSAEKNKEVFGKCANENWHGHNYVLFVTVKGRIGDDTGFVINLKQLSRIIKDYVFDLVDHKNLNMDVDFLKGQITSSENFAKAIWDQLDQPIKESGGKLAKIVLEETQNNIVEYYGGQQPY